MKQPSTHSLTISDRNAILLFVVCAIVLSPSIGELINGYVSQSRFIVPLRRDGPKNVGENYIAFLSCSVR